jgi:hypothetical protein
MKYLKMLGLAAIAAMSLMASVGASTAPATTLFTDKALTSQYNLGTLIHGRLSLVQDFVLTDGSGNTLAWCRESTISSSIWNSTGVTVSGNISSLTLGSCTSTMDVVALGSLEIEKTGSNEGKVVSKGTQITATIFGVSCTYGTGFGTTLGTITGGTEPVMNVSSTAVAKVAGSFLCPSYAGWDTSYTFGSPHAIYIGA